MSVDPPEEDEESSKVEGLVVNALRLKVSQSATLTEALMWTLVYTKEDLPDYFSKQWDDATEEERALVLKMIEREVARAKLVLKVMAGWTASWLDDQGVGSYGPPPTGGLTIFEQAEGVTEPDDEFEAYYADDSVEVEEDRPEAPPPGQYL